MKHNTLGNESLEIHVTQKQGNIVSDMAGEKVMLSIQKGKYYNLGEMGGKIWDMMSEPISISQIINNLLSEFDVDFERCKSEVLTFLSALLEEELVMVD